MKFKHFLSLGLLLLVSLPLLAQVKPVSWSYEVKPAAAENVYEVIFTARIQSPWHMYDLGPYDGGPNPTEFTFTENPAVELVGQTVEKIEPKRIHDPVFDMQIGYFEKQAVFAQQVKVKTDQSVVWEGSVSYQLCDDQSCLLPTAWNFTVELPAVKPKVATVPPVVKEQEIVAESLPAEPETVSAQSDETEKLSEPLLVVPGTVAGQEPEEAARSLWSIVLQAMLLGLAAFLTPCVFPMAPMTVSFFLKGNGGKKRGKFQASAYGLFIVGLYTLPVAVVILATYFIGGENVTIGIFNWIATHWLPNVLFFVVFMVFAASFFGAFEIRMPDKWVNKADSQSDKGGLFGVFFMALTLVLVSFSCTGPIVSSVLLKSTQGEIWEPIITMLAFSVAFALPFVFLAFFPSLLKNRPKSGGWLNSVKVTLGFLEVALGLKFLSIADQTYHWNLLGREVYLAIWIVVFALLGFYLLGKIRFKYDSEVKHIGVFRLALVIAVFSFTVYLIPGLWGAPLKPLSGYLPPLYTSNVMIGRGSSAPVAPQDSASGVKYGDFLRLPHGLNGYFDYEEGMAAARSVGKPVFIDITGHGCVNCREMEQRVWADPQVLKILRDDYVIVALYVDDKKQLPENQWAVSSRGTLLKQLGQINADFVQRRFGTSAQPYYVLLDNEGNELTAPRAYNLDIPEFVAFLRTGLTNYKKVNTP